MLGIMKNKIADDAAAPIYYKGNSTGILLIHGFTGTPFIFRGIAKKLADLDYTVSAPLLAGHGTTPDDLEKTSWKDWYCSIEQAYDELHKQCKEVIVVGASFGGNLCCYLATKRPVKALILIGVPRWIYKHLLATVSATVMSWLAIRYFNKPLGKRMNEDVLLGGPNYSYLKIPIKNVCQFFYVVDQLTDGIVAQVTVPTLIIQSNNDGLVKPKSGQYLFEKLKSKNKELIWIDEPHHELHNGKNRDRIYKYITDFMVEWK